MDLRVLLYPFGIVYDGITAVRNLAFEFGILKQKAFDIPVIAVGNLSVGGTGKTPMIEFLIKQLKQNYNVAVLSRGYGRKSNGFFMVNVTSKVEQVGDEPLQIKQKFKNQIHVAVCESRVTGIQTLIRTIKPTVILLDDAFQHRYVKASHYILLTSYDKLYIDDYVLPAGNLRESSRGASRANTIVVTKCPTHITKSDREIIKKRLNPNFGQHVLFTTISYDENLYNYNSTVSLERISIKKVTVVTGIAKPEPFVSFLKHFFEVEHIAFSDHHHFSNEDISLICSKELVITTEKDFVRLQHLQLEQLFYLPMNIKFIGDSIDLHDLVI